MRFLVDECLFRQVVAALKRDGHDVSWVRIDHPGVDDEALLATALPENRILMTEDRDFGELAVRLGKPAVGIVIIRVGQFGGSLAEIAEHVARVIAKIGESCMGSLTVIQPGRVRQRDLPKHEEC